MLKFQISPSKDFVIVKWFFIFFSSVWMFFTLSTWVMLVFVMGYSLEGLIAAIMVSVFFIVFLYPTLLFVNYDISFIDDLIVITNWFRSKKTYKLDELSKTVYRYRVYSTWYIVYEDKNGEKLFKTEYGKNRYFDYLESIGFKIENQISHQ